MHDSKYDNVPIQRNYLTTGRQSDRNLFSAKAMIAGTRIDSNQWMRQ